MKSTYAPLPFSYLSSDAKPKVGLRKDGVYGTSADFVPRSNQPEGPDAGDIAMSTEYPYSVYANANALNPQATATDHRGNQPQQTADHPHAYSQNGGLPRFQEATLQRPQKPEGGFQVYPPSSKYDEPSSGRVSPKEVDLERKGGYGYRGLPVVKRPHVEEGRSNAVGRVPSYYPPMGNNSDRQVNGVESPYNYTLEPKEKKPTTAVMAKDFDNFILVKDPNRPDSVVVIPDSIPTSANNDPRRNNNLQTLFEADEPRKQQLPRYNAQQPPTTTTENHYDISGGPSRAEESNARHNNQESGLDRSNYAIYHGHAQLQPGPEFATATKPEPPIYRGNESGDMQPDIHHHRSSDTHLVKDSDSDRSRTSGCCVCGKCASVVIAIIVTAIICLGAGFVAGWFGARAAGNDTFSADSSPSQLIFANLSTTTAVAERVLSTKPSAISSIKASVTSSSSKPLANSSTKALQVTSTIERRAAISTTVHSGK